jgi:hypothetical protein
MPGSSRLLRAVFLLVFAACFARSVSAGPLYAIGPDSTLSGPGGFYSISTSGVAAWLFDFANPTLGFNGGLAFNPGNNLFYAIANDSQGNSTLVSFGGGGGGAFTTIGPLGQGFISGLAYNSSDGYLYGISSDWLGQSSLSQISLSGVVSPVGAVGIGFYGGLTFRPSDGLLYGFSGDPGGVQREFQSIDPATAVATWQFELGDGSASFSGGVAWVSADGLFYVISNDGSGSTLQTLTPTGTLIPISGIGGGFWNVGLAAAALPIPEPSLWLPLAAALMAGLLVRMRLRAR